MALKSLPRCSVPCNSFRPPQDSHKHSYPLSDLSWLYFPQFSEPAFAKLLEEIFLFKDGFKLLVFSSSTFIFLFFRWKGCFWIRLKWEWLIEWGVWREGFSTSPNFPTFGSLFWVSLSHSRLLDILPRGLFEVYLLCYKLSQKECRKLFNVRQVPWNASAKDFEVYSFSQTSLFTLSVTMYSIMHFASTWLS